MMILDKKGSLHTLFNLGATTKDIQMIFFLQGSLMTILGGIVGVTIGVIIVFLQQKLYLVMLTPSLPYPVSLEFLNILIVLATIIVLGVLASKIASSRINRKMVRS